MAAQGSSRLRFQPLSPKPLLLFIGFLKIAGVCVCVCVGKFPVWEGIPLTQGFFESSGKEGDIFRKRWNLQREAQLF